MLGVPVAKFVRFGSFIELQDAGVALQVVKEALVFTRLEVVRKFGKSERPRAVRVEMSSDRGNGNIVFPVGYMSRVLGALRGRGLEVDPTVERVDTRPELFYDFSKVDFTKLRPEQLQMAEAFVKWDGGLIVSPTGSGKTVFCGAVAKMCPKARIIFAAPSIDTVATTVRYLRKDLHEKIGQVGGGQKNTQRVTVATYDSVTKVGHLENVDILIADEAHRSSSDEYANSFMAITSPIKRFGLTASPTGRSDKAEWRAEGLFGPIILTVEYYDSVASGSIVPLKMILHDNVHGPSQAALQGMRTDADRDRAALWANKARAQLVAKDILDAQDILGDPQTLILVSRLEHLLCLWEYLPDYEIAFSDVDEGKLEKMNRRLGTAYDYKMLRKWASRKDEIRTRFETGEAKHVLATEVFATGVSANSCGLVACASGSGASIAFIQSIGRGSRVDTGKSYAVVLVWDDRFSETYHRRALKLANVAADQGHEVIRLGAQQSLRSWIPPP
jgi:superfamily II DNA or RNA helicase